MKGNQRMGYRTREATGVRLKGGAVRRITITLNEDEFLSLRDAAVSHGRSISAEIARRLRVPIPQRGESGTTRKVPGVEAVGVSAEALMTKTDCPIPGAPGGGR